MKQQFLVLIAFFISAYSGHIYGQTTDSSIAKRIIVSTSALEYIPSFQLNTGNFNISTEIFIKNRISVSANFGIIKSYSPPKGSFVIPSINTKGVKIQFEGRHYLNRNKIFEPAIFLFWPHILQYNSQTFKNSGYYIAVHSWYQRTSTYREELIDDYIDYDPYPIYFKYTNIYNVSREVYGMNLKLGYQCMKKCGLVIDYAIGLGGQYITSHSNNCIRFHEDKDFPWNKLFNDGAGFYPRIFQQVRIGWGF